MIGTNEKIGSPVRQIYGKAEVYNASAFTTSGEGYLVLENAPNDTKLKVKSDTITNLSTVSVKVYGKNLLPKCKPHIAEKNGVTIEVKEDGRVILNGKATAGTGYNLQYQVCKDLPKGAKVTLSSLATGAQSWSTYVLNGTLNKSDGSTTALGCQNKSAMTATVPDNYTSLTVNISYYAGAGEMKDVTFYPMLEINDTATDYEEYIAPTTYTASADGTIEDFIPLEPNTTIIPSVAATVEATYNKVQLYNTFSHSGALQEIKIDRAGEEGKFFGFGICQKANIKLRDIEGAIKPTTSDIYKIYFGTDESSYINNFPSFKVTESHRDENTNALSITAYDAIKTAEAHTIDELDIYSFTLRQFAEACAHLLGLTLEVQGLEDETIFSLQIPAGAGANFDGTETIREALNAIAEVTQTIYFICGDRLIFKRLAKDSPAALTITKEDYITLNSGENRRLQAICATNELGNAITASISAIGTTQFIRDNPFLELRDDVAQILDNAIAQIGGITINQFSCSWRGNYLVEIGDKLGIVAKDNSTLYTFLLNDVITYNGAYSHNTKWNYTDSAETATNPSTLGEALKQTFARVDKVNKQIDIVASEANANKEAIAALQINTDSINASVEKVEKELADNKTTTNDALVELTSKVEAQITAEDVTISIQRELENGVEKVITATGFTFDETGLTVSKSGSEIQTQITEDGMNIKKGSNEVLTANNEGVKAVDLHATTFLIIGSNSRFEDFGNRTACFWIGG